MCAHAEGPPIVGPQYSDRAPAPELETPQTLSGWSFRAPRPFLDEFGDALSIGGALAVHPSFSGPVLARNLAGQPALVASTSDLRVVAIPSQPSAAPDEVKVVSEFTKRVLPALRPTLFLGGFVSEAERRATRELNELTAHFQTERARLRGEINAEQEFYARWVPLISGQGEQLKRCVADALSEVFEIEVTDLDQLFEDDALLLDLLLPAEHLAMEVRGRSTRNANENDLQRIPQHADTLRTKGIEVESICFVLNGQLSRPAGERDPAFSERVIEMAIDDGIALVTGRQILQRIEAMRQGRYTSTDLLAELSTPGPVEDIDV